MHSEWNGSPGNGITPVKVSKEPLATEEEASPGPDDRNLYQEREDARQVREFDFDPEPMEFDAPSGNGDGVDDSGAVFEDAFDDFTPEMPDLGGGW